MNLRRLSLALHLDGIANIAAGLALMAAGGWLAPHVGLAGGWPLRVGGVLLVAYGIENHLVARQPSRPQLTGLAIVDIGFAAGILAFVAVDPSAAATWARWVLAAAGIGSLVIGLVELTGRDTVSVAGEDRHAPAP